MPHWVPTVGLLALVGMLYIAKAAVVRYSPRVRVAVLWFVPLLALAVPVTWASEADWDNRHFYPVMNWVGGPVLVLAVPAASFAADLLSRGQDGKGRSAWWYLPEVLIGIPAWTYFWVFFSFYVLGWGWI